MKESGGRLPCLVNPLVACDCSLRQENARFMNELGKRRDVVNTFERQGYDCHGNALGVIIELLRKPGGGYYTTAFNQVFEFGGDMKGVRNWLRKTCIQKALTLETDPRNLKCTVIRTNAVENNYDPEWYLEWLRKEYFKSDSF